MSLINELSGANYGKLLRDQFGNIAHKEDLSVLARARRIVDPIVAYLAARRFDKDI